MGYRERFARDCALRQPSLKLRLAYAVGINQQQKRSVFLYCFSLPLATPNGRNGRQGANAIRGKQMARRHTPYYHKFMALGAEMVDRIGFDSAFKFTSVEAEHLATRNQAGLYDVYYQVLVDIKGRDAEKLLQRTLVNDVAKLKTGKVIYSSVCNEKGGMVDDLTCLRLDRDHFWLCPTPSRVDIVAAWMADHAKGMKAYVTNLGAGRAFISIQGPRARDILARLTDADLSTAELPYYSWTRGKVAEVPDTVISRTGDSGELGYELFYPGEYTENRKN